MRVTGHVARLGDRRGAYRVLVGKPEGNRLLVRPTRRWNDSIKMDLNLLNAVLNPICHLLALLGAHHILHVSRIRVNTWDEHIDCIGLAQDRDRLRDLLNTAMKPRKIRGSCVLAEDWLAFHDGLCFMELVSWLVG
jgi:hypothetical protein